MLRIFIVLGLLIGQQVAKANAEITKDNGQFVIPQTTTFEFHSENLERTYPIYISLPPGYTKNPDTKYPVIIMNDGPYTFPIAAGALDIPMTSGAFEKVIVVGIGFSKGDNMMLSRIRDYTPSEDPNWAQFKPGGAKEYLAFLDAELLPFIESRYAINSKKRTLVGHSAGGLFGSYVLLNKPTMFESYIILSPALFWDSKLLFGLEEQVYKTNNDLQARVYFAVGTAERSTTYPFNWLEDQNAFVNVLDSRNYPKLKIKEDIIQDSLHQTTFPIGFIKGMQWLYGK